MFPWCETARVRDLREETMPRLWFAVNRKSIIITTAACVLISFVLIITTIKLLLLLFGDGIARTCRRLNNIIIGTSTTNERPRDLPDDARRSPAVVRRPWPMRDGRPYPSGLVSLAAQTDTRVPSASRSFREIFVQNTRRRHVHTQTKYNHNNIMNVIT